VATAGGKKKKDAQRGSVSGLGVALSPQEAPEGDHGTKLKFVEARWEELQLL